MTGNLNPGERAQYLVRGVGAMRESRYGRQMNLEDVKLYDFLSIFHPTMSHEDKVAMVLKSFPDSRISRR